MHQHFYYSLFLHLTACHRPLKTHFRFSFPPFHRLEYLTWRHLLQKHLHAKVGSKELSQTYFSNLMDLLERLHAINEKVNKMYTFKVIESFKL